MDETLSSLTPEDADAATRLWQLWQRGDAPELVAYLAQSGPLPRAELLEVLRVDQRERWQRGERVLVESYVEQIPALGEDAEGLLDLVCGELVLRESRRETPQLEEYLTRFPKQSDQLRRQFEVHRAMMADTDDADTNSVGLTQLDGTGKISPDSPVTWLLDGATAGPKTEKAPTSTKVPSIPGYDILGEIDRGGMGVVYKARQTGLNRLVAIKMMLAGAYAGKEQKDRFRIEAEAVARLQHPNIIQIYEVGEYEGQPFFSLEYAEGGSLAQRMCGLPQPTRKAAQTLAILARGVHAAHQCGIVHRDLKPANVLLTADGVPKVTDFGLAKQLGSDSGQTRSGIIMGTPSYMAPEQAIGKAGEISPATDIYALGAILYEMLTGRPPFVGENSLDTLQQVLVAEPIQPNRVQPSIPRDLETVCLKCLAKEPARRYPSGQALADDLQRFLDGEPIRARRVPLWERWWKWAKRRPAVAGLMVLVFLVAVLGFIGILVQWQEALAARSEAIEARGVAQSLQARAEKQLYELSIAHADGGLSFGDVVQAAASLDEAPAHLRNWEWHYLHWLCRASRVSLRGHELDMTCITFGNNGKLLATGGRDHTIRIWDASTGRQLRLLTGHRGRINAIACDPSGKLLASSAEEDVVDKPEEKPGAIKEKRSAIKLWSLEDDTKPVDLPGHVGFVSAVLFLPGGGGLVSAGEDRVIRFWNLATHEIERKLEGHTDNVLCLACSPDGKLIASSSRDRTIRLWDAALGVCLRTLTGHEDRVTGVAFSNDGRALASCGGDGKVRLWEVETGKQVEALSTPIRFSTAVAFQPKSNRLAAICGEPSAGEMMFWELPVTNADAGLRGQSRQVTSMAFSPTGDRLALAYADGSATVLQPDLVLGFRVCQAHSGVVAALAYSPNGERLAAVDFDRKLMISPSGATEHPDVMESFPGWMRTVGYSGDGRRLAVSGMDPTIHVLHAANGQAICKLEGHTRDVHGVALNQDGSRLASVGEDQVLKIWDVNAGRVLHDLNLGGEEETLPRLAMTKDGRWVACTCGDADIRIYELETGKLVRDLHLPAGNARCLTFSQNGLYLVAGSGSETRGEAFLWNLQTQDPPQVLTGHKSVILGVAFSPDGQRLATCSTDRTVKVWNVGSQKIVRTLVGHTRDVQCVQFSPDGMQIAAGGADGTVRIWGGPASTTIPP